MLLGEGIFAVQAAEVQCGQERGAAKRNKCTGRLCRPRVTLDRAARRGLFPRGERPALGTRRFVDSPRQDRKALRKSGFPNNETECCLPGRIHKDWVGD
jgi:hypothetical protein